MKGDYRKFNDVQLVRLLRAEKPGSDRAFDVLYERYKTRVYRYCFYLLSNRDDSDDIFQETFIRFYKNVSENCISESVIGYLLTIARNLCYNHTSRQKHFEPIENDMISLDERNQFEKKELFDIIKAGMELLKPDYKEILILRDFDGLRYKEIGEVLDISEKAAKSKALRAKNKLIHVLSPYLNELSMK